MPTSYTIDAQKRLVRSRAWGLLTDDESRAHYTEMRDDPDFQPAFRQLCDLREMERIETTPSALRELAKMQVFSRGSRRAFVSSEDLHFGLARMLQVFCEMEGSEVEVFRTMEDAEKWLGLR